MTKTILAAVFGLMLSSTALAAPFRATVLVGQPNHSGTVAPILRGHGLEQVLQAKGFSGASVDSRRSVTLTKQPQQVAIGNKTVSMTLKRSDGASAVIDVARQTPKGTRHSEVVVGRADPTMVFMRGGK